jgi:RNA polymerase sigma-70 factor (ECF subfamily)
MAADALQSTFTKLIQSASSLKPVAIRAWLFRVAYNQAMEYRRHGDVNRRALQKIASAQAGDHKQSLGHSELHYDQIEKIKTALARLTEGQQQVVRLRIYHDKKFAEIADELGLPLGTVLTRMRAALKKLSTELEQ